MYKFIYVKSWDVMEIYKDEQYLMGANLKKEFNYIGDDTIIQWCEVWLNNKELLGNVDYTISIILKRGWNE